MISGLYRYRRVGYDERDLRLEDDGKISVGAGGCEQRWTLHTAHGRKVLTIVGRYPTCYLHWSLNRKLWTGRWQSHERMPIELVPLDENSVEIAPQEADPEDGSPVIPFDTPTITDLKRLLETWDDNLSSTRDRRADARFHYSAERFDPFHNTAVDRHYIVKLAEVLFRLRPRRYCVIGALLGTLESYLLQCYEPFLEHITVCDVDLAAYNAKRDTGALCYRNICGAEFGRFGGQFVYIRDNSTSPRAQQSIQALGPYDVVFVDGEHSYKAVQSDIETALGCLAPGGIVLVHDIELFSSRVPQGYSDFVRNKCSITHVEISAAYFQLGLGMIQHTP